LQSRYQHVHNQQLAENLLQQQHSERPTAQLLESFTGWAHVVQSAAGFDAEDHARGHAKPLAFATVVVAEQQLLRSIVEPPAPSTLVASSLTPQRMLHLLQQALRRTSTVGDPSPHGRAVTGVGQRPAVLRQLNDMLLPDTTTTTTVRCHSEEKMAWLWW
jgi:hypothetical protein